MGFEWSEIFCVRVFFVVQVCALRCAPVIVVFDLRLRLFELRNSQPQSVLRFCVLGGQGLPGLTRKAKNRVGCRCGLYVDLTWLVVCPSLLCPSDKIGPDVTVGVTKSVIRLTSTFLLLFSSY